MRATVTAQESATVTVVRDPAALHEARLRKAEKAFVAGPAKSAVEVGEWVASGDSFTKTFWVNAFIGEDEDEDDGDDEADDVLDDGADDVLDDGADDVLDDEDDEENKEPKEKNGLNERVFEVEFKPNTALVDGTEVFDLSAY